MQFAIIVIICIICISIFVFKITKNKEIQEDKNILEQIKSSYVKVGSIFTDGDKILEESNLVIDDINDSPLIIVKEGKVYKFYKFRF